jgi:hypothetical protein
MGLLHEMRYPRRSVDNRISWGPVRMEFTALSTEARTTLLEFFQPFGILADATLSPAECAEALVAAGYDAVAFCSEHSRDGIAEIASRAADTLEAIRAQKSLLRAGASAGADPQELLRIPGTMTASDPVVRVGLVQRIVSRIFRRN